MAVMKKRMGNNKVFNLCDMEIRRSHLLTASLSAVNSECRGNRNMANILEIVRGNIVDDQALTT